MDTTSRLTYDIVMDAGGLPSYALILMVTFLLLKSLPHLFDDHISNDVTATESQEQVEPTVEVGNMTEAGKQLSSQPFFAAADAASSSSAAAAAFPM